MSAKLGLVLIRDKETKVVERYGVVNGYAVAQQFHWESIKGENTRIYDLETSGYTFYHTQKELTQGYEVYYGRVLLSLYLLPLLFGAGASVAATARTTCGRAVTGQTKTQPSSEFKVGRREVTNSVSNLGQGYRAVDEFAPGTAFSGAFDRKTKQLLAYPSSRNLNNQPREAVLKDGTVISENVVRRNGGHLDVNNVLSSQTGHPAANENNVGFTLFLKDDGNLRVEWYSGSLNSRFKGNTLPKNMQSEIRRELKKLFPNKEIEG